MSDHPGAGLFDRGIHIADGIVRRPRGYWSVSVYGLLQWLDSTGFGLSPKPAGLDEQFEYIHFIDGADQCHPLLPFIQSLDGARAAGAFARKLESALAAYEPSESARWQLPMTTHGQGPVQHGDVGPWNLLWDNARGEICGIIDWDLAGPAPAGYDSGILAWFMVPVMNDDRAYQRGFGTPIDREERLWAYCDGYGISCGEMLDRVIAAQNELSNRILSASEDDPPTYAALKKLDLVEQFRGDMEFALNWKNQSFERDAD
ncbi:aminoglycoside phosphotransferase family protein [Deinococcus sp.]|uniref:aminoglycoside phosphotransferase family protein n=1 Tax=Deinococcus sp. TaxID=47478 RepID=UPI00286DE6BC|nr:aminoglycoside phosphotransferase family protein [Deinococcus sp.]